MTEANATLARLTPLLQAAGTPEIDASPLHALDTAALAVLLACKREAAALVITGAPAKLIELAQLYGVDGLLNLRPVAPDQAAVGSMPGIAGKVGAM
jgi:phospholipid transport system transporter-binding protein